MKISLIGMSGSGKTYWAKKLKAEGLFIKKDVRRIRKS